MYFDHSVKGILEIKKITERFPIRHVTAELYHYFFTRKYDVFMNLLSLKDPCQKVKKPSCHTTRNKSKCKRKKTFLSTMTKAVIYIARTLAILTHAAKMFENDVPS